LLEKLGWAGRPFFIAVGIEAREKPMGQLAVGILLENQAFNLHAARRHRFGEHHCTLARRLPGSKRKATADFSASSLS